jgi:hypothetical protein
MAAFWLSSRAIISVNAFANSYDSPYDEASLTR